MCTFFAAIATLAIQTEMSCTETQYIGFDLDLDHGLITLVAFPTLVTVSLKLMVVIFELGMVSCSSKVHISS